MKRWIRYSIGSAIVSVMLIGGYAYWGLNPDRHFENVQVPLLAAPSETHPLTSFGAIPWAEFSLKTPEQVKPEKKKTEEFNVLVLGIDAREKESSRTDVIMVVHVIPSERKVNMVSLPRDTMVKISGVGYTKINHAHLLGELKGGNRGGTDEVIQVVSDFLDTSINYYVKTNFVGFKDIIDTIGGVDVEVEKNIHLRSNDRELSAGMQHIDGDMTLGLVRERWAFPEGDFGRQKEQSKILKGIAKKLLTPEHIVETADILYKVKNDLVDTNFTDSDLLSLADMFNGMKEDGFQYMQIPGHSEYHDDPLVQSLLYYWVPDLDKVKSISENYFK